MKKGKKILIIIISAILVIALGFGIFYLVSPREFLQLFLSDSSYAAVVVAKNAATIYENFEAVEGTGELSVTVSDSLLTNEDIQSAVNDYVNSLDFSVNVYRDENAFKGVVDLSDEDGSVLTAQLVSAEKKQYLKVDQFDLGWLYIENDETSTNETSESESEESTSVEAVDVKSLISIEEASELSVGGTTVKGEIIKASFTVSQLKNGVADDFIPDEYKDKVQSSLKSGIAKFEELGISEVSIELYVNNKNEIVGIDVVLEGTDNNMSLLAVFVDKECDAKLDATLKEYGTASVTMNLKQGEFKEFEIPTDAAKFDKDELKSEALSYVTTTLPSEHPEFKEVYNSIVSSLFTDVVGDLFGELFEESGISLDEEIDVSSLVDGFISYFGGFVEE